MPNQLFHQQQQQLHAGPSTSTTQLLSGISGSAAYPPDTIESIVQNSNILKRKRPKIYARDLTLATPKRVLMALRSGLLTETIWAINVINVLLYDDSAPLQSFNLNNIPELLNLIVEHFISCLAILYPKFFKV